MHRSATSDPSQTVDFGLELNQTRASGSSTPSMSSYWHSESHSEGERTFRLPDGPTDRLVSLIEPGSVGAELLRTFASRLVRAQKRYSLKKLLITSSVPEEGKTFLAANLASTLALHHQRVVIVDGDLRRCSLSRWFNIADDLVLSSEGGLQPPPLRKAEGLPMWVLPGGQPTSDPTGILQSQEFTETLGVLTANYDWIIIDSPPLIPFGDAATLAAQADGVILVTRSGVTPKKAFAEALKSLDQSKIVATILNGVKVPAHKYYCKYYAQLAPSYSGPTRATLPRPIDEP